MAFEVQAHFIPGKIIIRTMVLDIFKLYIDVNPL